MDGFKSSIFADTSPQLSAIIDNSGSQLDLNCCPITQNSIPEIDKMPLPSNSKTYQEYFNKVFGWYSNTKKSTSGFILPQNLSLFYFRPLIQKLYFDKKSATNEQIEKLEATIINEIAFDNQSLIDENIKSKTNLISEFISPLNSWPGWSIPAFPDPNLYQTYELFNQAAKNWYEKCTKIIKENTDKFFSQTNHFTNHSQMNSDNENQNENENFIDNSNQHKNETANQNKNENPNQNENFIDSSNQNENESQNQNENENPNQNQNENENPNQNENENPNPNQNENENPNQNENDNPSQNENENPNQNSNQNKILFHPISFNSQFHIQIVEQFENSRPFIKRISKSTQSPSTFLSFLQNKYNQSQENDSNGLNLPNIESALKKLGNSYKIKFPTVENELISKIIEDGCDFPIQKAFLLPPLEEKSNLTIKNLYYLLDLDLSSINPIELHQIFQFVRLNFRDEFFQNLLNNTPYFYKITKINSAYQIQPTLRKNPNLSIIEPFNGDPSFFIINNQSTDGDFLINTEDEIKIELERISILLFQWHYSIINKNIFDSLKTKESDEISSLFEERSQFFKQNLEDYFEINKFPFSFPYKTKSRRGHSPEKIHSLDEAPSSFQYDKPLKISSFNSINFSDAEKQINESSFSSNSDSSLSYQEFQANLHRPLMNCVLDVNEIKNFTSPENFYLLLISIFKVSIVLGVSELICPNTFLFMKFISQNCSKEIFKKLSMDILANSKMVQTMIFDFCQPSLHVKFDLCESIPMVEFTSLLFQSDYRKLVKIDYFEINDYEWFIQFLLRLTQYLNKSNLFFVLIESILKFLMRSITRKSRQEWTDTVPKIQGLLFAYLPYESNPIFLCSQLRIFSVLMKNKNALDYINNDQTAQTIFCNLTSKENLDVLTVRWKIVKNLFVYHSERLQSFFFKFENVRKMIVYAVSDLRNLSKFQINAIMVLKILIKLFKVAFPPEKVKDRNKTVIIAIVSKNITDSINTFLKILSDQQIFPGLLANTYFKMLNTEKYIKYANYLKVLIDYDEVVALRPAVKKLYTNYQIDQQRIRKRKASIKIIGKPLTDF